MSRREFSENYAQSRKLGPTNNKLIRFLFWPCYRVVGWVMKPYTGMFPETTRRMEMVKVVLVYLLLWVLAIFALYQWLF